jgi:hypothetical protein
VFLLQFSAAFIDQSAATTWPSSAGIAVTYSSVLLGRQQLQLYQRHLKHCFPDVCYRHFYVGHSLLFKCV